MITQNDHVLAITQHINYLNHDTQAMNVKWCTVQTFNTHVYWDDKLRWFMADLYL